MKKLFYAIFILLSISNISYSSKEFVLYGFRIGQSIKNVKYQLGKPSRVISFKDGFKAYLYKKDKHYVVFQTSSMRPDLIWGIQLTGNQNPKHHGFKGLNLGDSKKRMLNICQKPDSIKVSEDELTKKKMKDISYYSYLKSSNYSIEIKNNKVSSIKILYNGPNKKSKVFGLKRIFKVINKKEYFNLCSILSADFVLYKRNKKYIFRGSILSSLINNNHFIKTFFDKDVGILAIDTSEKPKAAANFLSRNSMEMVVKYRQSKKIDICFLTNHEGFVIKYIRIY